MNRNEYRRAFIMLRPAAPGWSGHVRLERRTMTGSMYFVVSAPDRGGTLNAALVGRRGSEYSAAPLGALRPDSRGQLTLAYGFDPRLIEGRPLEAYQLIVLAQVDAGGCRIVLSGNVDGAHPMDDGAVCEAVCALYLGDIPAADLPAPGGTTQGEPSPDAQVPEPPAASDGSPAASDGSPAESASGEEMVIEDPPSDEAAPEGAMSEAVATPESAAGSEAEAPPDPLDLPAEPTDAPSDSALPSTTRIYTRMRAPADEAVPAAIEAVEAIEATAAPDAGDLPAPRYTIALGRAAAACSMPLEDGYSYVRVPLPEACGLGYCLVGVRADGDRVDSVRIALPGSYAPEPPAGLAGSVWLGAGDGTRAGYWVFTVRCPGDGRDR